MYKNIYGTFNFDENLRHKAIFSIFKYLLASIPSGIVPIMTYKKHSVW